ncbi:hypothetical protein SAMN05444168_3808 [Paraburkholderia phenazinium]|uniref:Uncharacterized protein n=1 Tax=Paraburkholderia phenazinium TaxID=60549 RepID=A0A1N6I012_9BURK|nr:hypothetical protein SAMN05444168_3808 [Paraburkholderia phenazinium]
MFSDGSTSIRTMNFRYGANAIRAFHLDTRSARQSPVFLHLLIFQSHDHQFTWIFRSVGCSAFSVQRSSRLPFHMSTVWIVQYDAYAVETEQVARITVQVENFQVEERFQIAHD